MLQRLLLSLERITKTRMVLIVLALALAAAWILTPAAPDYRQICNSRLSEIKKTGRFVDLFGDMHEWEDWEDYKEGVLNLERPACRGSPLASVLSGSMMPPLAYDYELKHHIRVQRYIFSTVPVIVLFSLVFMAIILVGKNWKQLVFGSSKWPAWERAIWTISSFGCVGWVALGLAIDLLATGPVDVDHPEPYSENLEHFLTFWLGYAVAYYLFLFAVIPILGEFRRRAGQDGASDQP